MCDRQHSWSCCLVKRSRQLASCSQEILIQVHSQSWLSRSLIQLCSIFPMRKPLPPSMLLARSTSTSRRQEIKYVQPEEARYRWKHLYHGVVAPCVLSASRDRASIFVMSIVSSFHQLASLEFQYSGPASLRFKAEELLTEDLPIRLANFLDKNPQETYLGY